MYVKTKRRTGKSRRDFLAFRGIGIFLTTGRETEALGLNPRSVVQAARRERKRIVAERVKAYAMQHFTAFCHCPSCMFYEAHLLWNGKDCTGKEISRVCQQCGFTWQQLK